MQILFNCLIGEPNETSVVVEKQKMKGLIDSSTQISSILDTFLNNWVWKSRNLKHC